AQLEHLGPAGACAASAGLADASCVCCLADFEEGDKLSVLPCGHMFCEACIVNWAFSGRAASRHCPVCRADFRARRTEPA
ncbi:RMR3, partial [Symbiodinium pilosum]